MQSPYTLFGQFLLHVFSGRQNNSTLELTAEKIHDALMLEAARGNSGLEVCCSCYLYIWPKRTNGM